MSKTTITAQPGTPFIDVEREFDATPEQLYRAASDPALLPQWMGPAELQMRVDEYDVRSGGSYRYVQKAPDGSEFGFRGCSTPFGPTSSPCRPSNSRACPTRLPSRPRATRTSATAARSWKQHSVFPTVEARDAAVASGMTSGIEESLDRLQAGYPSRAGGGTRRDPVRDR